MSIELDWQIGGDEPQEPETPPQPPVRRRWRWPRISRRVLAAVALILVAAIAGFAAYYDRVYHAQLDQVKPAVLQIAHFEAQAVSKGDRDSYLAVQDPADSTWREMQAKRFGKLEKEGLPEWGWKATDAPSLQDRVTLEPGGARLDVTYRFSVTQPMPNGPTSVTLVLPQYYKQTPSGWVRALPIVEYWGAWRNRSGKYFAARFLRRDADLIEPLVPRMDALLARVCDRLPCPPQPIYVVFENSPDALASLADFTYGFDDGSFQLKFPSPQLFGVPADEPSRQEFYRAIGTRVVEALVYEASGRRLNMRYPAAQEIVRWNLAGVGLTSPYLTPVITHSLAAMLQLGVWQSFGSLPLRSSGSEAAPPEGVLPLALSFLEAQYNAATVIRLMPALATRQTMGEVISGTLRVNPGTFESAWWDYVRQQAGLAASKLPAPKGELALWRAVSQARYSIWRIGTDGTEAARMVADNQGISAPAWSPDGKRLAFLQRGRLTVMDADTQQVTIVATDSNVSAMGWLPDGRLRITAGSRRTVVVNLDTNENVQMDGYNHIWSPDGKRVSYTSYQTPGFSTIWVADANGNDARQLVPGLMPAWSPDGRRLAFYANANPGSTRSGTQPWPATEIQVVDVESGAAETLARVDDLLQSPGAAGGWTPAGSLAWSPDGTLLAAPLNRMGANAPALLIVDTVSGAVRARWNGTNVRFTALAWSPDSRYLALGGTVPGVSGRSTDGRMTKVIVLDTRTNRLIELPGQAFDWSPTDERGEWLALAQDPSGILLVTPDLAAVRWLDAPGCLGVAWRPGTR